MKESKVSVLNYSGEKLIGIETLPSTKNNIFPTVILVHGFAVDKDESGMFSDLAGHLSDEGILVYRFDFSGCGESEGDYSRTSLSKLRSDLKSIIHFVRSNAKTDNSRIGILAQSFGTAVTVSLAPEIKCLVMLGSISHPKETISKLFGDGYEPDGISTREKYDGTIIKIKPQFWEDLNSHNLLESIKKINSPVLFIHGQKDDKVPLSEMEDFFNNANEPKEKIVIKNADHGLRPYRDKMYKIVVDWFTRYLV